MNLLFLFHFSLYTLISLFLFSCGGGSTHITEADSGLRPARLYIAKLQSLSTPEQKNAYLQSLQGQGGQDLDWAEFWTLLDKSPIKDSLLKENRDPLLSLHSVDCRPTFYQSYIQFLITNVDDISYMFEGKNQCGQLIGAAMLNQAIEKYFVPELADSHLKPAFQWIIREVEARAVKDSWTTSLSPDAILKLRSAYERLLKSNELELAVLIDDTFSVKLGWSPVRSVLQLHLVIEDADTKILEKVSSSFILSFVELELRRSSPVPVEKRLKPVLYEFVANHSGDSKSIVEKILALTSVVSRFEFPRTGLRYLDSLQKLVLQYLSSRSEAELQELLQLSLAYIEKASSAPHRLQLLWLALELNRRLDLQKQQTFLVNAAHETLVEQMHPAFNILQQRLRTHHAPLTSIGMESEKYCELLHSIGFPTRAFNADQLPHLMDSLESGCIILDPSANNKLQLQEPLNLSLDSLLILPDAQFEIIAPQMEVGMVLNHSLYQKRFVAPPKQLKLSVEHLSNFPVVGYSMTTHFAQGVGQ